MVVLFPYLAVLDGHNFIGRNEFEVVMQVIKYMENNLTTNFLPPDIMLMQSPIIVTDEPIELEIIPLEIAA